MNRQAVRYFLCIFSFVACLNPFASSADNPVAVDVESTSTEWRNNTSNLKVVRRLNQAYEQLPFSRECEGVLI